MFNHSNFFAALLAMLKNRMKKKGGKGGKGGGTGGTGDLTELMNFPISKFDAEGRIIDAIDDALKRFE